MKRSLFLFACVLIAGGVTAKKVKFAVDMTGQTISSGGVHIVGDFQAAAGLGADWDPSTAALIQQGNTQVYSIVVDIPAFKKYEYKFINGDLSYDSEVVPVESRVDLFNDNRWLYVDSLTNDTSFAGAILYSGNAPSGKYLVRYKVNMAHIAGGTGGIHLGTDANSFDPAKQRLYSFGNSVYEAIGYMAGGNYSYRFFSGNTAASAETVPSGCSASGNRTLTVTKDTVLTEVCFASCVACTDVGIRQYSASQVSMSLYPNPAKEQVTLQTDLQSTFTIVVFDLTGRLMKTQSSMMNTTTIALNGLDKGIYTLRVTDTKGKTGNTRLIVE